MRIINNILISCFFVKEIWIIIKKNSESNIKKN